MIMPKRKPPIVRVKNTQITIEYYSGTKKGPIIEQLQRLLAVQGYIRINRSELIHLAGITKYEDGAVYFGDDDRLKCIVPRRSKKEINEYIKQMSKNNL
jgi:hypothetical protein